MFQQYLHQPNQVHEAAVPNRDLNLEYIGPQDSQWLTGGGGGTPPRENLLLGHRAERMNMTFYPLQIICGETIG